MAREIDITEAGAVIRTAHRLSVEAGRRAQFRAALRGIPIVATATPVDRGITRSAWHAVPTPEGAELRNDSPVAGILEMGSRPHWPPIMPILRWIVRKEGLDLKGGRRSFESLDDVPPQTYALARAIQRSIAQHGTKAYGMVRNNLDKLARIVQQETERALRELDDE